MNLPPSFLKKYCPATSSEIRSWSFGQVRFPRAASAISWKEQRQTLDDQRIFGPRQDYRCACGKYDGLQFKNMICDMCGVKITTTQARRQRFGHIELPVAVPHPLGSEEDFILAFPVLPAAIWEAKAGKQLADLYEELICAAPSTNVDRWASMLQRLTELLLPVVVFAHDWGLEETNLLARGLALCESTMDELW